MALLRDNSIEPEIIEYMQNPLDTSTVAELCKKLGKSPGEIIRKKEHKALGLPDTDDDQVLIQRIADNPQILERPIVVNGDQARLGRPPEDVLEIL